MSPGRSGSHVTGLGSPVIESSKAEFGYSSSAGGSPPVARATAHWIARRAWSFWVEMVNSSKSGLFGLCSS